MDHYAVIGWPITHSRSPFIHRYFASQTHQSLEYERIACEPDQFESTVNDFFYTGGKGLNVTLPFKERAYRMAQHITERVRLAQAANTLWLENGLIHADNTDGLGLLADYQYLNIPITGQSVLVFGAGGAVKGVLAPLLEKKPRELFIANRTESRARELIDSFKQIAQINQVEMNAGSVNHHRLLKPFDIVINATSASIKGETLSFPNTVFAKESYVYDMSYGRELTPFLQQARQLQVTNYYDGLGMLIEQAAESFRIWRHCRPTTKALREALRREIGENS
ncbi:MAG: shikimate dehydrogenase [Betaproteobacteria bacterium]|nr:shikimate dehydrogenase [Betaproteobacteria bacterium]